MPWEPNRNMRRVLQTQYLYVQAARPRPFARPTDEPRRGRFGESITPFATPSSIPPQQYSFPGPIQPQGIGKTRSLRRSKGYGPFWAAKPSWTTRIPGTARTPWTARTPRTARTPGASRSSRSSRASRALGASVASRPPVAPGTSWNFESYLRNQ